MLKSQNRVLKHRILDYVSEVKQSRLMRSLHLLHPWRRLCPLPADPRPRRRRAGAQPASPGPPSLEGHSAHRPHRATAASLLGDPNSSRDCFITVSSLFRSHQALSQLDRAPRTRHGAARVKPAWGPARNPPRAHPRDAAAFPPSLHHVQSTRPRWASGTH